MASSTSVKSNPGTTPVTTNVWQQRMAARAAMQKGFELTVFFINEQCFSTIKGIYKY